MMKYCMYVLGPCEPNIARNDSVRIFPPVFFVIVTHTDPVLTGFKYCAAFLRRYNRMCKNVCIVIDTANTH